MTNKNQNIVLHQLMDNAIDFLNQSIRDLRKKPKYSVIHFHAAIELILKSRLLEEHWSLVVSPRKDPDLSEFLSGSFVSVSLDDSINRINKIIPPGLNKQQIEAFKAITKHRNRMVHFFHSTGDEKEQASKIQEIVKLQLTSWYYLHILMLQQWKKTYQPWRTKIGALDKKLRNHLFYLEAIYDDSKPRINKGKAEGWIYTPCISCAFDASEHQGGIKEVYQSECLVCQFTQTCVQIECSECSHPVIFQGESSSTCSQCQHAFDQDDLISSFIDEGEAYLAVKDGGHYPFPVNCGACQGYESVVEVSENEYLCAECFDIADNYGTCEYCNDESTHIEEDTYYSGCDHCDGYSSRYQE